MPGWNRVGARKVKAVLRDVRHAVRGDAEIRRRGHNQREEVDTSLDGLYEASTHPGRVASRPPNADPGPVTVDRHRERTPAVGRRSGHRGALRIIESERENGRARTRDDRGDAHGPQIGDQCVRLRVGACSSILVKPILGRGEEQ